MCVILKFKYYYIFEKLIKLLFLIFNYLIYFINNFMKFILFKQFAFINSK